MKLKFLIGFLLFISFATAQTASVSGIILDKEFNNEPLPFANVFIKGTDKGSTTDDKGAYYIALQPGSYTLVMAFMGYETKEIPFTLKASEKKVINHTLAATGVQLSDLVIMHEVTKESESALLHEQQKAVEIKQAIGAEEISKKGISDVAAAVAKTTGISKQEGGTGSLYVRGLGDRYNMSTLNGLPLPSNNPALKNISLDIFSTDIVEFIGIDKTYNYKNFGDFSGANIDIISKNYKGKGDVEIGTGFSVNSNAISQDKFYLQDGPDFHGFNNTNYPNNPFSGYNFNTSWNKEVATPVGSSLYLRGGNSYDIGKNGKLSFFVNTSFDNGYSYKEGVARGSVSVQGVAKKDLFRESYNYQTNTNLMGNINYKINSDHNLRFNSMFINSSTQKHEEYNGIIDIYDIAPNGGGYIRRSNFDRTSLFINQLLGEHTLSNKLDFDWGLSYNTMRNLVPDRMVNTFIPVNNDGDLSQLQVADNNESENHRYYQEMTDDEVAGNFNLAYKFAKTEDDEYKGKINIGYSARYKEINFDATQFNFNINQTLTQPVVDLNNIDGYFNQANFNANYFSIKTFFGGLGNPNALRPQNFSGQQIISAGYIGLEYQLTKKLFAIAGFRTEYIIQDIDYKTAIAPNGGKKNFDTMEYLPMITAKYEVNDKQNIKLAASKTYTLPQFKERAPFQFEDVNQIYIGNPDLYNSTDYNVDLQWEYFPNDGEVISVTGFGKLIQNPINEVTIASATNDISYINTGEKAMGAGAELEFRKNIFKTENTEIKTKSNLGFGVNVSYLYTDQDFDAAKVREETNFNVFFTEDEGRLSGASDLLINTDLNFNREFKNDDTLSTTLSYGYFSERVSAIGTNGRGHIMDSEVGVLDFIFKYNLGKKIGFGFSAKNLLNPTIERYQADQNVTLDSYKKGLNYSLSFKYKF